MFVREVETEWGHLFKKMIYSPASHWRNGNNVNSCKEEKKKEKGPEKHKKSRERKAQNEKKKEAPDCKTTQLHQMRIQRL